jgi:hypothetical protein
MASLLRINQLLGQNPEWFGQRRGDWSSPNESRAKKATLTSVVASSVLILVLVAVRAAQEPREETNPLSEAEKTQRILALIVEKKLR